VLTAVLPRQASFVAKAELTKHFGSRFFLRRIQTEFVERFDKQKGIEDARRLSQKAKAKRPLVFFPEGTFTRMPGLLPFHMGAFIAAAEANAQVIPIAIRGTRSILRSESWFPRRGSVTLTIGAPIQPEAIADRAHLDTWGMALALRSKAREHILRHCGEPDLSHERTATMFF
jgi:1-acyl-sn-glycerol-3-phosphate acyltransferase